MRRLIAVLTMLALLALPFFGGIFLTIYAIVNLDFTILTILFLVCILQSRVTKNQSYIRFVRKHIKPHLYVDKFQKIYEEDIAE